jgi:hypothetical protein
MCGKGIMGLAGIERRVGVLERALVRRLGAKDCNCRFGQQTSYHTATELEQIIEICCPVHDVRDLGHVRWIPSGLPLRAEDRDLCSCPPCAVRDFVQGTRGPLTLEEQEREERRWQQEYAEASHEEFRREQARGGVLLHSYQQKKRSW